MGMGVSEKRSRESKKSKKKEQSETHRYGYIRRRLQESGIEKKNYASLYVLYDREMPLFSRFLPYSDVSSAV